MERLEQKFELCYAAGTHERPCGYWPGSKPNGDNLTGEFGNRSGFRYVTGERPALWVAVYPRRSCNVKAGRILWRARQDSD